MSSTERHPARMTVTFLGISAGQPTTTRGLSCISLEREGEIFIFDCGEGAQMQFRRAGLRFGRIRGVFITHLHGDHVTGLPGLLMSLQLAARTEPLVIVGPPGIDEYVRTTARLLQTGFGYELRITEIDGPGVVLDGPQYEIRTEPLEHRIVDIGFRFREKDFPGHFDVEAAQALGVTDPRQYGVLQRGEAVQTPQGRRVTPAEVLGTPRRGKVVAYCSDTRPCKASVRLGGDADLLIHESTFAQDRLDDAIATGHSTAAGAAAIAREAAAHRLVLTHFSPRYNDTDPMVREASAIFEGTEAARELEPMDV